MWHQRTIWWRAVYSSRSSAFCDDNSWCMCTIIHDRPNGNLKYDKETSIWNSLRSSVFNACSLYFSNSFGSFTTPQSVRSDVKGDVKRNGTDKVKILPREKLFYNALFDCKISQIIKRRICTEAFNRKLFLMNVHLAPQLSGKQFDIYIVAITQILKKFIVLTGGW